MLISGHYFGWRILVSTSVRFYALSANSFLTRPHATRGLAHSTFWCKTLKYEVRDQKILSTIDCTFCREPDCGRMFPAKKTLASTTVSTHNIGWNEWTPQNNCLELDLHIDISESSKQIVQSHLSIMF